MGGIDKMKRNVLKAGGVILAIIMIITALSFSLVSFSDGNDPLVTLSYLTEIVLPQMKKDIVAEVVKSENASDAVDTSYTSSFTPEEYAPVPAEVSYTLLELGEGECVYADSVLEFIVRPGSEVEVISPFESQGIADITNGIEYLDGDEVIKNAYCIIPRGGDGRGIRVTNEKSYILVRGEYTIG